MQVTFKQMVEASRALEILTKIVLPIPTSLEVARLSNRVDTELVIYKKALQGILAKHQLNPKQGEKEGWFNFSMPDEGDNKEEVENRKRQVIEAFQEDLHELLSTEVPNFDFKRIKLPEKALQIFAKVETDEAQPKLLKQLADFVEVE